MADYKTPGVYIEEISSLSGSISAVPTAVPAFIGYTQKAAKGRNSLINKPLRITSFAEYMKFFGGPPAITYSFTLPDKTKDVLEQELVDAKKAYDDDDTNEELKKAFDDARAAFDDFEEYILAVDDSTKFNLFNSMRLFFNNGGGNCYIVSVGNYKSEKDSKALMTGIEKLKKEQEPTMIVVPDAVLVEGCADVQAAMLKHCGGDMRNRITILDIQDGDQERSLVHDPDDVVAGDDDSQLDVITKFRSSVNQYLDFGAVYYPWLQTTLIGKKDVSYDNIKEGESLKNFQMFLRDKALSLGLKDEQKLSVLLEIAMMDIANHEEIIPDDFVLSSEDDDLLQKFKDKYLKQLKKNLKLEDIPTDEAELRKKKKQIDKQKVHDALAMIIPNYNFILEDIRERLNVMPPSGAMAGIYSYVDNTAGVSQAPANVGLTSVVKPTVMISNEEQEDLNKPLNGKAVNAIRFFKGKGTIVWGARTLMGNSGDWRYIGVRRSVLMIEESIKLALGAYVFKPNNLSTWLDLESQLNNFLILMWNQGVLVGATPVEAYSVSLGLGITMTPQDVLDGIMRINIGLCVVRPAEFIVVTFEQMVQGAG